MRKALLVLALIFGMTGLARAQQKWTLSAAGTTCTTSNAVCLIYLVDAASGGATFTVGANASANTLQFEATGDGGATWVAFNVTPSNGTTAVTSTTSTGTWQGNVAGYTAVRIRMSTLVSGTATVSIITSIASARAGGGAGLAPNTPGIPASNGPTVFYASNYGVKADTYAVFDAVCSNGSNIVTSASANFSTAAIRVGERIWAIPGGGVGNSLPSINVTTVLSIDSNTQIHTTANGNALCGSSQALIWGDDDRAAWNTFWTAVNTATDCGAVYIPAGQTTITGAVMTTTVNAPCLAALQNTSVTLDSTGWQSSVFVIPPDFDWTTCTTSSCIGVPNIQYNNVSVNAYGLSETNVAATGTKFIISANSPSLLQNFSCQQVVANDTHVTGVNLPSPGIEWSYNLQAPGCGGNGPTIASVGAVVGTYEVPGAGAAPVLSNAGPNGTDLFNSWFQTSGVQECSLNVTGFANAFGMLTSPGAELCVPAGHLRLTGGSNTHNQGIANRAALKITSAGFASATNYNFSDAGAGEFAVSVDGTSTFEDGCGNTYTGNINVTSGGKFLPCWGAIYPGTSEGPPVVTGTGACATSSTQKGTMYYGQFTCTGTTGASTITITPTQAATNGFYCRAYDSTTTTNLPVPGTISNTACTFSVTSVTANDVIGFEMVPY